jgi:hypothetical protein
MVDEVELAVPGVAFFENLMNLLDSILDPDALVFNGGRHLGSCNLAVGREGIDVCECAADVYSKTVVILASAVWHDHCEDLYREKATATTLE